MLKLLSTNSNLLIPALIFITSIIGLTILLLIKMQRGKTQVSMSKEPPKQKDIQPNSALSSANVMNTSQTQTVQSTATAREATMMMPPTVLNTAQPQPTIPSLGNDLSTFGMNPSNPSAPTINTIDISHMQPVNIGLNDMTNNGAATAVNPLSSQSQPMRNQNVNQPAGINMNVSNPNPDGGFVNTPQANTNVNNTYSPSPALNLNPTQNNITPPASTSMQTDSSLGFNSTPQMNPTSVGAQPNPTTSQTVPVASIPSDNSFASTQNTVFQRQQDISATSTFEEVVPPPTLNLNLNSPQANAQNGLNTAPVVNPAPQASATVASNIPNTDVNNNLLRMQSPVGVQTMQGQPAIVQNVNPPQVVQPAQTTGSNDNPFGLPPI